MSKGMSYTTFGNFPAIFQSIHYFSMYYETKGNKIKNRNQFQLEIKNTEFFILVYFVCHSPEFMMLSFLLASQSGIEIA